MALVAGGFLPPERRGQQVCMRGTAPTPRLHARTRMRTGSAIALTSFRVVSSGARPDYCLGLAPDVCRTGRPS